MSSSSRSIPRFVIDASIAVKWYLLDEEHTHAAGLVFDRISDASARAIVPEHFYAEVMNAIRNAVRSGRVSGADAHEALTNLRALGIPSVPSPELLRAGLDCALRFDCAFYDALYIALAEEAQCPFIHADRRLHHTLRGRFERELWVEDYARRQ